MADDKRCVSCSATLPGDAVFCHRCGATVTMSSSAPAASDPLQSAIENALGTQYRIIRLLGRGGMGAVYLAEERALERDVAIKVLPPDAGASPDARERFRREARTAAQLTHSNIVPLYTFGSIGDLTYLVMGFVRGESLAQRLRREGRIPHAEARRIVAEIADALDYAHRRGVVHRDVKPDNVLLEDDGGRAMLADFGIAKQARTVGATLTQAGVAIGTPSYMSPEQVAGDRDVDGRSDLYSLGVIAYEMLSGRRPFESNDARHVMVEHASVSPVPLATLAEMPADLSESVMRCLAKAPADRFADGSALRAALLEQPSGEELPEELAGLKRFIPLTAVFSYLAGFAWLWLRLKYGASDEVVNLWRWLLAWFPPLMVMAFAVIATANRIRGWPWSRIFAAAMIPPMVLEPIWPARWARYRAFFDRMPPLPRRARKIAVWCLSAGAALLPFAVLTATLVGDIPRGVKQWLVTGPAFLIGIATYGCIGAVLWWGRRQGLSVNDSSRLLSLPPNSPLWRRPEFARLLSAAPPSTATSADDPASLLRAIAALAQQLEGSSRGLGSDSVAAARDLVSEIDAIDRELTTLARENDPAELARLERKLASIGSGATGDQLRGLLQAQVELLRSLAQRQVHLATRRQYCAQLLGTLRLQLANLRAAGAAGASEEITGRIRALCAGIASKTLAQGEVDALLQTPDRAKSE